MIKPLIGITSFAVDVPVSRSAVNQTYVKAILAAGGAPISIPLGLDEDSVDRVFAVLDGLLLPGGDDVAPSRYGEMAHPNLGNVDEARDALELALTSRALEDDLPVLGICRGIQLLAVAAGGTLYQDLPTEHPSRVRHEVRERGRDYLTHSIEIAPRSRLASILGCSAAKVNSFHHQAVKDMPPGFAVSAQSSDGVIEGVEAGGDRFVVAVQCHPEEIWHSTAPEFARLFTAFVDAARQHSLALRSSA